MAVETDTDAVARVRDGDPAAFAEIFEAHHERILRYLCRLIGDPDAAEDVAQETFVKAYRALSRGSSCDNLDAWLHAIATNTALSALRRRRIIAWLSLDGNREAESRAILPDHAGRLGERELIDRAFAKLSRADAACLLLRFQQGLEYPELAAALGISVTAARMRLSRARAAFREAYLRLSQEVCE